MTTTPPDGLSGDPHALAGAYAVDALDDVTRAAFERHLTTCADCAEEVTGLRETAARLALGVAAAPPPGLRGAVLAQVARTPQLPPLAGTPGSSGASGASGTVVASGRAAGWKRTAGWKRSLSAAAVAASLLVGVSGAVVGWNGHRDAERARTVAAQARLAEAQRSRQVLAVLADPKARTSRAAVEGGGTATLVVGTAGTVLLADRLAPLPSDRVYQLWVVRGKAAPIPAGLGPGGSSAASGWARVVEGVREGDAVALTVEPAAGSQAPTTTPVVAVSA
ncbi:MAG: anti-sigma factor [Kineosporiaceae bacterium]